MWSWLTPELTPEAKAEREKQKRIALIVKAMADAPRNFNLMGWAGLSETGVQREYAKAVEPLLKRAAEEGEALWDGS